MRLFPVFSRHLMRQLERQGYVVVKIAKNWRFPDKDVYYFEETPQLRELVTTLTKNR